MVGPASRKGRKRYLGMGTKQRNPLQDSQIPLRNLDKVWILQNYRCLPFDMATILLDGVERGVIHNVNLYNKTLKRPDIVSSVMNMP